MDTLRRALRRTDRRRPRAAAFAAIGAALALAVAVAVGIGFAQPDDPPPRTAAGHSHAALGDPDEPISELDFIDAMIPHHALALAMSQTAEATTDDLAVFDIARDIIVQQGYEIDLMRRYRQGWFGVEEDAPAPDLTPEALRAMGMDVDLETLARTRPYEPAFYTAMIPHHRAAIVMARRVLRNPDIHPEMQRLAEGMIRGQTEEIRRMREFRAIALGERPPPQPPDLPETPLTP